MKTQQVYLYQIDTLPVKKNPRMTEIAEYCDFVLQASRRISQSNPQPCRVQAAAAGRVIEAYHRLPNTLGLIVDIYLTEGPQNSYSGPCVTVWRRFRRESGSVAVY